MPNGSRPPPPATAEATPELTPEIIPERPELLTAEIIATYPHDTDSYTQGLVLHDGLFYESTGMYGESDLRKVEPETGEVLQQADLTDKYFGEGLVLVDDRLIQITWKEDTAFVYDLETFEPVQEFEYTGEGWGLCYDDTHLYMSDGSETLAVRDPETLEVTNEIEVTLEGKSASEWAFQGIPL
ncbi:MAG TPA: glutaminyl-peptide cyclotransferase, partial [Phototrophicaceae bacterium]|nr:glutaminyl-peptide cyclotransferase [Phototrophicaceae bacterium]